MFDQGMLESLTSVLRVSGVKRTHRTPQVRPATWHQKLCAAKTTQPQSISSLSVSWHMNACSEE